MYYLSIINLLLLLCREKSRTPNKINVYTATTKRGENSKNGNHQLHLTKILCPIILDNNFAYFMCVRSRLESRKGAVIRFLLFTCIYN